MIEATSISAPPRFRAGQRVWVVAHPAEVLSLIVDHDCPVHPGQYGYRVLLTSAARDSDGWPYCESQLIERE